MAIVNNSLLAAGSFNLTAGASSEVPLVLRIETAVADLQCLGACRAQWGDRLDQPVYREAATRAIASLSAIPEFVPAGHVESARQMLAGPQATQVVTALVATLQPLQAQLDSVRDYQEQSLRERLLTMNQIVNGGEPLAGLPDLRSIPSPNSSVPEWTKAVGKVPPGVEISFQHGRFWIHDSKDVSLFDLRNWTRRWFGGLFVGAASSGTALATARGGSQQDGAMRLRPGVRWPVAPGDKVRLGKKNTVQLLLPRTPILEALKGRIASVKNLDDLSTLLRENGVAEIANQIDRYLESGGRFDNVPHEGGLSLKIQELVLQRAFAEIHQRYTSGLPEGVALQMLRSLAIAVQNASSSKEMIAAVNTSIVPGVSTLVRGMSMVFSKKAKASLKDVPEEFGLRSGVLRFSANADKELRGELARLSEEVQTLSQNLSTTNTNLQGKIAALAAAEEAARELGAQFKAAREQWESEFATSRDEWNKMGLKRETELGKAQKKIEELDAAKSELEGTRDGLEGTLDEINGQLAEVQAEKDRLLGASLLQGAELSQAHRDYEAKDKELRETKTRLERELRETKERLTATEKRRGEFEAKATRLEAELTTEQERFDAKELEQTETAARLAQIEASQLQSGQELVTARGELAAKAQEAERLNADITRLDQEMAEKVTEISGLADELRELREAKSKSDARAGVLEGAEQRAKDARKGEKKVLDENMIFESRTYDAEQALALAQAELAGKAAAIGDLEAQVAGLNEEIERINRQWTATMQAETAARSGVENELAAAMRGAAAAEELKTQLAERDEKIELLDDQLETARKKAAEKEQTLKPADEDTAVIRMVSSTAEIPVGIADHFFDGGDPRLVKVDISMNDERKVSDADGIEIFNARIVAGGESDSIAYKFNDSSLISGKTSLGGRNYQQDGIYASWFTLPDGTVVKVLAGSDGAGGHGGGEVVSSAFLQGIHARVAEAAHEGRIPTAAELFQEGFRATLVQRKHPDRNQDPDPNKRAEGGTGTGAIVVIVGNTAMIATAGDAMVVHSRKTSDGRYETVGYSDVQTLAAIGQGNVITSGVHENKAMLYVVHGLQPGDRFLFGSDGLHENILGGQYKVVGANQDTLRRGFKKPHPTQASFQPLNLSLDATAGAEDAADSIHDTAQFNIDNPGQLIALNGRQIQLPQKRDKDNIFAMNYEHGAAADIKVSLPDFHSRPLEVVAFALPRDLALQRQQGNQNATVGSDPSSDLFIRDSRISPNHAKLGFNIKDGLWYIQDVGASTGTAINGTVITPNRYISLPEGAVLQLGPTSLSVYYADDGSLQLVPVDANNVLLQTPPQAPPQSPFPPLPPPSPPPRRSPPPPPPRTPRK